MSINLIRVAEYTRQWIPQVERSFLYFPLQINGAHSLCLFIPNCSFTFSPMQNTCCLCKNIAHVPSTTLGIKKEEEKWPALESIWWCRLAALSWCWRSALILKDPSIEIRFNYKWSWGVVLGTSSAVITNRNKTHTNLADRMTMIPYDLYINKIILPPTSNFILINHLIWKKKHFMKTKKHYSNFSTSA